MGWKIMTELSAALTSGIRRATPSYSQESSAGFGRIAGVALRIPEVRAAEKLCQLPTHSPF